MAKRETKPSSDKQPIKERLVEALRFYETYVELDGMKLVTDEGYQVISLDLEDGRKWEDISESTLTKVIPNYDDDGEEMTIGEFLDLTQEVQAALKRPDSFSAGTFLSGHRMIAYVDFVDALSRRRMERIGEVRIDRDSHGVSAKVASGFSLFTLAMMKKGHHLFSKYYPPVSTSEYFIEVFWGEARAENETTGRAYVDAMIFALHEELGISVYRASRVDIDEEGDEQEQEESATSIARPLMVGAGMQPLLFAYNKSHEPGNREYEFLQLAKTVEYVATAVVRRLAHQEIRKRLQSVDALRPSATYISGLINLVSQQQSYQKDGEAFRLAIEQCCDAQALASVAPTCAGLLVELKSASDSSQKKGKANADAQKKALTQLANILYSTRCQFAHEKANYTPKGDECPEDQLPELMACARLVAQQCIRWYNDLSDHERQ